MEDGFILGLILLFGVVIGIALMIPVTAALIKQTEKIYEDGVRKLEERVYGRESKDNDK